MDVVIANPNVEIQATLQTSWFWSFNVVLHEGSWACDILVSLSSIESPVLGLAYSRTKYGALCVLSYTYAIWHLNRDLLVFAWSTGDGDTVKLTVKIEENKGYNDCEPESEEYGDDIILAMSVSSLG